MDLGFRIGVEFFLKDSELLPQKLQCLGICLGKESTLLMLLLNLLGIVVQGFQKVKGSWLFEKWPLETQEISSMLIITLQICQSEKEVQRELEDGFQIRK